MRIFLLLLENKPYGPLDRFQNLTKKNVACGKIKYNKKYEKQRYIIYIYTCEIIWGKKFIWLNLY